MRYLGGTIRLCLKSKGTIEEDMEMYQELREVSKKFVEKYGAEIDIEHIPHYESTYETLSMGDVAPFEG